MITNDIFSCPIICVGGCHGLSLKPGWCSLFDPSGRKLGDLTCKFCGSLSRQLCVLKCILKCVFEALQVSLRWTLLGAKYMCVCVCLCVYVLCVYRHTHMCVCVYTPLSMYVWRRGTMGRVCNGLTYNTNTFANSAVAPVKQLLLFLKGDTLHIVPLLQ